jgi:hypothetical protein
MISRNSTKNNIIYLLLQLLGWGIYIFVVGLSLNQKRDITNDIILFLCSILVINIAISHLYRFFIKRYNWASSTILMLSIKVFISCITLGLIFSLSTNTISLLFTPSFDGWIDFNSFFTGFILYFMWSALYFVFAYFVRSRSQELKNLRLESLKNEIELQNLRSQLNPHFMFNAMNSIRALIDEDPKLSKKAITQLSNILRNALIHGNDKVIPLKEELAIVDDYLGLEKIRYEERLEIIKNISPDSLSYKIPPLLIQTLVENAIKHGIAKLMKGGVIKITTLINNKTLQITITNSGKLNEDSKPDTGIGIINTQKRLSLEYGNRAYFSIKNIENEQVEVTVIIPITH